MKPRTQIPSMSLFNRFFGCFFARPDTSEYLDEDFFPEEKLESSSSAIEKAIRNRIAMINAMVNVTFEERQMPDDCMTYYDYTAYHEWTKYISKNYHLISGDGQALQAAVFDPIPDLELQFISLLASEKWILDRYIRLTRNTCDPERWDRIKKLVYDPTKLFIHRLRDIVASLQKCEDQIEQFKKMSSHVPKLKR